MERFNYIKEGEWYIAKSVNLPGVITQAKTLDELKTKSFILFKAYINFINSNVESKNNIELKEITKKEFLNE